MPCLPVQWHAMDKGLNHENRLFINKHHLCLFTKGFAAVNQFLPGHLQVVKLSFCQSIIIGLSEYYNLYLMVHRVGSIFAISIKGFQVNVASEIC